MERYCTQLFRVVFFAAFLSSNAPKILSVVWLVCEVCLWAMLSVHIWPLSYCDRQSASRSIVVRIQDMQSCDNKQALNLYVGFLRDKYTKASFGRWQNATRQTIVSCFTPISPTSRVISGESLQTNDSNIKYTERAEYHYERRDRELGNKLWTRQQRNLLTNCQDGIHNRF